MISKYADNVGHDQAAQSQESQYDGYGHKSNRGRTKNVNLIKRL